MKNGTLKKTALVIIGVALAFLIADTALRIYAHHVMGPAPESVLFEPHPLIGRWHRPNSSAIVTFRGSPPHRVSFNAFGCRGPNPKALEKSAGCIRVICLGGSSTEEGCVPDGKTWPERMQAHIDEKLGPGCVEIINLGVAGFTTGASVSNLVVNGLKFRPDMVVVYHANNDFWKALLKRPGLNWQETYVDYEARTVSLGERLLCKSILFDRINRARYYDGFRRNREFLERYWRLPDSAKADIPMDNIEVEAREALISLQRNCSSNGATLVIALQATLIGPDLPEPSLPRMWELLRYTYGDKQIRWGSFDNGLGRIRNMQRVFAIQHGLTCIDVNSVIPKDPALYFDHIHYTESGSEAIGLAMAQGILKHLAETKKSK